MVQLAGLYEEWCEQNVPRIHKGGYDFVIFQTIGWLGLTPPQHRTLCCQLLPALAGKVRAAGARTILYDKYIPLQDRQKDPRARMWCGRYPGGYRSNYLLHVMAGREAGIEKITFGGAAVHELWRQKHFAELGYLYCDPGHPGAMAHYISAVNLAYLLTGEDPAGSPVRKLPLPGWAWDAFQKAPAAGRPTLYEANKHRVKDGWLELSDAEARILQQTARKHQRKWAAVLRANLDSDEAYAKTKQEIRRFQEEMCKFEAHGLDAGTVASLKKQFAEPAEPGGLPPVEIEKIRRKSKSIAYAGADVRAYVRRLLSPDAAKQVGRDYTRYWDENNSKLRDDVYFEGKVLAARLERQGQRDEARRIAETCAQINHVFAMAAYQILLGRLGEEDKKKVLAAYRVTGAVKRNSPVLSAWENEHHADEAKLRRAWDLCMDIWSDPNLMDKLKARRFDKAVLLEADREFARRIAAAEAADSPKAVGTYTNPVGRGILMGDPFAAHYGRTYYLTGTTDAGRGFRLLTSANLVDWAPGGFALQRGEGSWGQRDFWAPELFRHRGRYYLVYSASRKETADGKPGFRICLAAAEKPAGPYRDVHAPWCDPGYPCIDGHVFVDRDGAAYLYFAKVGVIRKPTFKLYGRIHGVKLAADLSGPVGKPVLAAQAEQPWETPPEGRSLCNEGAFVFRRGERYYMTYSANHYAEPFYGIGYATADNPLGPWRKSSHNPLVSRVERLGVSGPGHCSITTSPDGREMFMVYHVHADPNRPSGRRTVNIDRLTVAEDGRLKLVGPTRSRQPLPSGAVRPGRRGGADPGN